MEGVVFRKSSKFFPARYLRLGVTVSKIILKSQYEYLLRSRLYDIWIVRKLHVILSLITVKSRMTSI